MKKHRRSLSIVKYIYIATGLFLVALSIYIYIQFTHQLNSLGSTSSIITPFYIIVLFLAALIVLFYSYYKLDSDLQETIILQEEKEKRAAELIIANKELAFQNEEKEKRAAELIIANKELAYQNQEKEKRAAELIIANKELAFQNEEKEKRASELVRINNELLAFAYVSSHDLQEPLRNIQMFSSLIVEKEFNTLSDSAKGYFTRIEDATKRMRSLIEDLISYSQLGNDEHVFEVVDLHVVVDDVIAGLKERIDAKHAVIDSTIHCNAKVIPFQLRQLMHNLVANSLKFSQTDIPPRLTITSRIVDGKELSIEGLSADERYCHISVSDNGIGFEPKYSKKIFEVFQRLHGRELYGGTGIGLAIVQKIVNNHHGIITATSVPGHGTTFDIYFPEC